MTLGLVATGAALGAALGAISLLVATALLHVGPAFGVPQLLDAGAKAGALTGSLLAPASAWTLMRRVPLGRAIGATFAGGLLGSIGGSLAAAGISGGLVWSILGAPVGFLLAIAYLRSAGSARAIDVAPGVIAGG